MAPRIVGIRERMQVDIPIHIAHLEDENPCMTVFAPNPSDCTTVIVDVAASRADITVDIAVRGGPSAKPSNLRVSGPWLTGNRESTILDILSVANDAAQEGKHKSALQVIAEALERPRTSAAVLRPVVVPVRKEWHCTVRLNEGAPPGPVDVWIRTLETRDVA